MVDIDFCVDNDLWPGLADDPLQRYLNEDPDVDSTKPDKPHDDETWHPAHPNNFGNQ